MIVQCVHGLFYGMKQVVGRSDIRA